MTEERTALRIGDVTEGHPVVMLTTMVGRHHSSRPVVCAAIEGDRLWFLAPRSTEWVKAVEGKEAIVHLTIADDDRRRYVSLNGVAAPDHDRSRIEALWRRDLHGDMFPADDPEVVAIAFDISDGECWTGSEPTARTLAVAGAEPVPRSRTAG